MHIGKALLIVMVLVASAAYADESDPLFQALDADRDGFISRTEAAKDDKLAPLFDTLDTNKDTRLDRLEFAAAKRSVPETDKLPPKPSDKPAP